MGRTVGPTFTTKSRDGGRLERPSGQRLDFLEILDATAADGTGQAVRHRLRVHVSADSYATQSFGRIERWDGNKWQPVAAIAGPQLQIPGKLAYKRHAGESDLVAEFATDRARLIKMAEDVLGFTDDGAALRRAAATATGGQPVKD